MTLRSVQTSWSSMSTTSTLREATTIHLQLQVGAELMRTIPKPLLRPKRDKSRIWIRSTGGSLTICLASNTSSTECPLSMKSSRVSSSKRCAWSCTTSWTWLLSVWRSKLATKQRCLSTQRSTSSPTMTIGAMSFSTPSPITSLSTSLTCRTIQLRIFTSCTTWSAESSRTAKRNFCRSIALWLESLKRMARSTSQQTWRTSTRAKGLSVYKKPGYQTNYPRTSKDT